jgi:hypothetical protein
VLHTGVATFVERSDPLNLAGAVSPQYLSQFRQIAISEFRPPDAMTQLQAYLLSLG